MALTEEMPVLPGTIRNARISAVLTRLPGEMFMPGRNPCPPGCQCGHHTVVQSKCPSDCECGRHLGRPKRTAEDLRVQNRDGSRARRARIPGENAEYVRRWREAHPEKVQEYNGGPLYKSGYRLKYMYGLTPESWARRFAEQDGCCYLCSEPLDLSNPRKIHVDHDHSCCRGIRSCGKCIRGLACEPCNRAIGLLGDNPERIMRVAARLAAANAEVAARLAAKPVQAELFDINAAASRQKEVS